MQTSLRSQYLGLQSSIERIERIAGEAIEIPYELRHMVAELAILQVAVAVERFNESVFLRVLCGSKLLDHRTVKLKCVRCTSFDNAEQTIRGFGRAKRLRGYLKWLAEHDVLTSVSKAIDSSDAIVSVPPRFSIELSEIKDIRNYVAHKSKEAAQKYKAVVNRHFGPSSIAVRPGKLLFREHSSGKLMLEYYALAARVYAKELVSA